MKKHVTISALLEFSHLGFLENIYLLTSNDRDQKTLERSLGRIIREDLRRNVLSRILRVERPGGEVFEKVTSLLEDSET